jgi:serine/threonine protein kinase
MTRHAISTSRYERGPLLGEGPIGKTYSVQERSTLARFVFKFARAPPSDDSAAAIIERLISVSHPCLLSPQGYALSNPQKHRPFLICARFVPGSSLAALLESKSPISDLARLKIIFGIAEGLRHLHSLGIVHSALTATNVLLGPDFAPLTTDFGLGAFRGEGTGKQDCVAFGELTYAILTGDVVTGRVPPFLPGPLGQLVSECCGMNVGARPSFDSVVLRLLRGVFLPLGPGECSVLRRFQSASLGPSFMIRAVLEAARDVEALAGENSELSTRVDTLSGIVTRLANAQPTRLGHARGNISSCLSTPHAFSFFAREVLGASAGTRGNITASSSAFPAYDIPGISASLEPGICAHLTERHGGNPAELGVVEITGNSSDDARAKLLPKIIDYRWDKCWTSRNEPGSWVQFDFGHEAVRVARYAIKTYPLRKGFSHLRSWVLLGSIDGGRNWVELDRQTDSQELNGKDRMSHFRIRRPTAVTQLKIEQTGVNHAGDHFLILTNVEFYEGLRGQESSFGAGGQDILFGIE